ncbi:MAG: hypothetical protein HOP19_04360, partial [Acidobacteria bacterium]|nr:hypothetical protein [Acidobacteriota bacterium]
MTFHNLRIRFSVFSIALLIALTLFAAQQRFNARAVLAAPARGLPVFTALSNVQQKAGSSAKTFVIARVADAEEAPSSLHVSVNFAASATVNGVTISGIQISADGNVSATVATNCNAGTTSFTLRVMDNASLSTTASLAVTVLPNTPPAMAYHPAYAMDVGETLTVNPANSPIDNGTISTVTLQSVVPALGGTVTVSAYGAVTISNPSVTGNHIVKVRLIDSCSLFADFSFSVNVTGAVCPVITVAPTTLSSATRGNNYAQQFGASGGNGSYSYAVSAGTLPSGLTLASNGNLAGTPTVAATNFFTIRATDLNGCQGARGYALVVNSVVCSYAINPNSVTIPAQGGLLSAISVTAGVGCDWTAVSNVAWLTITNGAAGSGNGSVNYSAAANPNPAPRTGTLTIAGHSFTVNQVAAQVCATLTVNPSSLPALIVSKPFNQTLVASGGNTPYSFAVTNGVIPAGINLNAQGALTGTPMIAGDTSFTVTATDANGCKGTRTYHVTIQPRSFTSVSAASYLGNQLASDMIVAGFGVDLAAQTAVADTSPLPLQLAGVSVRVRDSQSVERMAPLFFVSPTQVNYLMPTGTALGLAHVTLTNAANLLSEGDVNIASI